MTNHQDTTLFAIYKLLEKKFKHTQFPPGYHHNVGDEKITVTLPPNTLVSRSKGKLGDGQVEKKATQNLYGYATWALMLKKLQAFHQAAPVRKMLMEALQESLDNQTSVQEELEEIDPEIAHFVNQLKRMPMPTRKEATPREVYHQDDLKIEFHPKTEHQAA